MDTLLRADGTLLHVCKQFQKNNDQRVISRAVPVTERGSLGLALLAYCVSSGLASLASTLTCLINCNGLG